MEHMLSSLPYDYKEKFSSQLSYAFASRIDSYNLRVREVQAEFWDEEMHSSLCLDMFRSVLTPYIQVYDRPMTSTTFRQSLVLATLDRVPNLTSLYFSPLSQINRSTDLASVIHHLASLETFTYRVHCTDELIAQLALHCTQLKVLHISYSRGVTNNSFHSLVQLRKLQSLELDGTRISTQRYGSLLSELPEIKNIKFRRRLENIVNPLAMENLLTISHVDGHAQNINILTQRCPNITNLNLGKVTVDLAALAALPSLRSLFLANGNYATSHVTAVLIGVRATLTELKMLYISNVSLQDIVTHCRILESLALWKCLFLPLNADEPLNPQLPHFRNLIYLEISKRRGDHTNYNYIRHYVSLKKIRLESINIFTVEFTRGVVRSGIFTNLEEFCVRESGRGALTMEAVDMLIQNCPRLNLIEGLGDCPRFNAALIQRLERRSLMRNLDLAFIQ
jgi:hypothetical protein